ncbi:hypothetical protein [Spirosoma sp. KNUC1025]|uniref:hypothetical protein n=1 Tax=Spirosoma sp. KNUC1025 TaxID=2894082 RepID=UPI003866DBEE|nr:hypothetical protein LN737_16670 [Spirosoma sp. KNUC1025]
MKTLITSLFLIASLSTFATPNPGNKKDRPTKLVQYQMGAFITADGEKLRVNIDKQLGGQVFVQLVDTKGRLYYTQTLESAEDKARLSLDITALPDGEYVLKVSNGLEVEIRNVTIATPKPTPSTRTITATSKE